MARAAGSDAATAALRIVEGVDTGRSLGLCCGADSSSASRGSDAPPGSHSRSLPAALPAGTTLLSEQPLVALATDSDCCDRCMATGLGE